MCQPVAFTAAAHDARPDAFERIAARAGRTPLAA